MNAGPVIDWSGGGGEVTSGSILSLEYREEMVEAVELPRKSDVAVGKSWWIIPDDGVGGVTSIAGAGY